MHQKSALVVPSTGIGDGCLFLALCYNLAQAGYKVDCVHTNLSPLKDWIPSYNLYSREELDVLSKEYDLIIINKDSSDYTQNLLKFFKNRPVSIFSPSSRRGSLISENPPVFCKREVPFLETLGLYFKKVVGIDHFEKKTGIQVPVGPKEPNWIAIHASASSLTRQWPLKRFMKVYKKLKKLGYRPVFVFWHSPQELELVQNLGSEYESKVFDDLKVLTTFLNSCQYFIGNDSGLGHLASSLNVPTLTLFNCPRKKLFWQPNYIKGVGIAPSQWIPNIKGLRIRNYAFSLIFPWQVMRKFLKLQREYGTR